MTTTTSFQFPTTLLITSIAIGWLAVGDEEIVVVRLQCKAGAAIH
jgi:hypothetical protein